MADSLKFEISGQWRLSRWLGQSEFNLSGSKNFGIIVLIHKLTSARFLKARSPLPALISVIAHEVPVDTPIPDALLLWRVDKNNYTLRSNMSMTLESKANVLHGSNDQVVADIYRGLQNILNDFQERHGRITTVNRFLHSEYNGLSDTQPKDLLRSWWQNRGTGPDYSCWYGTTVAGLASV